MMFVAIVVFIMGVVVGVVIGVAMTAKKPAGTLKMDESTGDPYLFLELHVPIDEVLKMETVEFKVDTRT